MVQHAKTKLLNPTKIKMSRAKALIYLTVAASIGAFSSYFFVIAANLYTPGLAGICNGIAYTINDIIWWQKPTIEMARPAADTIMYWIFYGTANIPIIIFSIRWFSKRFMIYSLYYFIVNFLVMMLFSLIPSLSDGLVVISPEDTETTRILVILFFSVLGGVASGAAIGLAFKVGACTMGLDPVVKHVSRTRDINVAPIFAMVATINTTIFILIRAAIPMTEDGVVTQSAIQKYGFLKATLFSPEYIGSWIFIGAYTTVAGTIYSSSKKVEVFATSMKTDEISEYFNSVEYHRGHSIYRIEGGYSKQEKKAVKMIVNVDEMHEVVTKIAAIDDQAFITVKELYRVYDVHNWTTMTDEDKEKEKYRLVREQRRREKAIQNRRDKK